MLREARNCSFVRLGAWPRRRYGFAIGSSEAGRLRRRAYLRAAHAQREEPVPLTEGADGRRWWWYRDRFWWEDEGYGPEDVVALVAERERRRRRALDRAHAALAREAGGDGAKRGPGGAVQAAMGVAEERDRWPPAPRREPIPRDVRLAVWRRDGGRCCECGAGFDLQYDHVIPLALGGAGSVENLQLLCGDCNRAKGASL